MQLYALVKYNDNIGLFHHLYKFVIVGVTTGLWVDGVGGVWPTACGSRIFNLLVYMQYVYTNSCISRLILSLPNHTIIHLFMYFLKYSFI